MVNNLTLEQFFELPRNKQEKFFNEYLPALKKNYRLLEEESALLKEMVQ